jgi:serine/threonine protein kinase
MPSIPTLGRTPLRRDMEPRGSLPFMARPQMPRRASYDLFECIEQHERLSEGQAKYIFAQVVDTVWYLDSIGITHRDIKDENLVIDKDFKVTYGLVMGQNGS